MGFITSLLGGLADQVHSDRQRQEALAQQEAAQQQSVYKMLLDTGDPEYQALGLTGLMEKPKKDFFGHLKKSQHYEKVRQIVQQINDQKQQLEATKQPAQAAPPPGGAAMPDAAPATGGGGTTGPATPSPALAAPGAPPLVGPPVPPDLVAAMASAQGAGAGGALPPGGPAPGVPSPMPSTAPGMPPPPPAPPADLTVSTNRLDPSANARAQRAKFGQMLGLSPAEIKTNLERETFPSAAKFDLASQQMDAKKQLKQMEIDARAAETVSKLRADREKQAISLRAADERLNKTLQTRLAVAEKANDRQEIGRINKLRGEQVKTNSDFAGADEGLSAIRDSLKAFTGTSWTSLGDKAEAYGDYKAQIKGFVTLIGRTAGEKGVFTKDDAERFQTLLKPSDIYTAFDPDYAAQRLKSAYDHLDEIRNRKVTEYQKEIDRGRSTTEGAPGAPASSKDGAKTGGAKKMDWLTAPPPEAPAKALKAAGKPTTAEDFLSKF